MPHNSVNEALGMSDALIAEQAYLIECGIRPMMLFHRIRADPVLMGQVASYIERCAEGRAVIPFVYDEQKGMAWVGYAASKWVFDTFRWATESLDEPYYSRVLGLLLGYSPVEIAKHDAQQPIRRFPDPTRSPGLIPTQSIRDAFHNTERDCQPIRQPKHTRNLGDKIPTSGIFDLADLL